VQFNPIEGRRAFGQIKDFYTDLNSHLVVAPPLPRAASSGGRRYVVGPVVREALAQNGGV